ncbi:MAG: hypothetical protein ABIE22_02515, partial [archaeon]
MYVTKKKVKGKEYYYLRESKREGDKVKSVNVAYLGKDEASARKMADKFIEEKEAPEKEKKIEKEKNKEEEKEFVSFIQEAGLIWGPEPEIYGGLAGFYTYGPLGKLLKNKVENSVR